MPPGTPLSGAGALENYVNDVGSPLPKFTDHPPNGAIPESLGGLVYTIDNGNGLEVWSRTRGEEPDRLDGGGGGGSGYWSEDSGTLSPSDGQALSVDGVDITNFSTGWNYTIFRDDTNIFVIDRGGDVVYGGPDAIGVSDPTDMGEILQTTVNNHGDTPSIRVAPRPPSAEYYVFKTTASCDKTFSLWGAGGNRVIFAADGSVGGGTAIEIFLSSPSFIHRFDNIKFGAGGSPADPDIWVDCQNVRELNIFGCEFRDAQSWGVRAAECGAYNHIDSSWFLAGAGFNLDATGDGTQSGDIHVTDSKVRADSTVENFSDVIFSDTFVPDSVTITRTNIANLEAVGNIGTRNAATLDTLSFGSGTLIESSSQLSSNDVVPESNPTDVSATGYTQVSELSGAIDTSRLPAGTTLYGNLFSRLNISNPSSTGDQVYIRPEGADFGVSSVVLDELEISTDATSSNTFLQSGWTELTSAPDNGILALEKLTAKVDSGTGQFGERHDHGLMFEVRVD